MATLFCLFKTIDRPSNLIFLEFRLDLALTLRKMYHNEKVKTTLVRLHLVNKDTNELKFVYLLRI